MEAASRNPHCSMGYAALHSSYPWYPAGNGKGLFMIHAGKKILVFIALLISASLSMADVAIPPLKARVTDLTGTLSANEATQLEPKPGRAARLPY